MRRKGNKQNKEQIIKYECNCISQERMIEIQAEAFYRALKKIEQEKMDVKQPVQKNKRNLFIYCLFMLNILICPWKIHKRFRIKDQFYDSVLTLFVSYALCTLGFLMWLAGILSFINKISKLINYNILNKFNVPISVSALLLVLGSLFIVSGMAFLKEEDSNKIYGYSACIIALVGCVVSIIALLISH